MKIFGIPIKVDASFFVLSFLLAYGRGANILLLEWVLVVFISVLLHELGHALVARKFGLSPSIKLYSMGGLTSWDSAISLPPWQNLLISLAGPAAGFLLGILVLVAGPVVLGSSPSRLLAVTYFDLIWVNIGWGIFNLMPMLPLDGGNVLLTLEEWILRRKSQLISYVISLMVALGITFLAIARGWTWIAILGVWFAFTNGSALSEKFQAYRDRKFRPLLDQARDAFTNSEFEKALDLSRQAQKKASTASIRSEAVQSVIFILIYQRRFSEAEEELSRFLAEFGADPYLTGLFHFQREEMAEAIPHLKLAFERAPTQQWGMFLYQALINDKSYVEALELCGQPVLSDVSGGLYANLANEAFASGAFRMAAQAGTIAFGKQPDQNVAYNTACALARDSEITEACKWLERAIDSGFNNKELIATDPDLSSLRSHPEFETIMAKMRN
ncbi:MAG: site-2 protease family protein [Pyrinomonadaceae bacterium]